MKNKNSEKKLYEYLGVNFFRKYILFNWEKICTLFNFDPGYRISGRTVNDLEKYKSLSKNFAVAHFFVLITLFFVGIVESFSLAYFIVNCLLNLYCIMTQRYIHIRINELIEKLKQREAKLVELNKKKHHDMNIKKSLSQSKKMEIEAKYVIVDRGAFINADLNLNENKKSTYITDNNSRANLDQKQRLYLVRDLLKKSNDYLTIDGEINKDVLKSQNEVEKGYTLKK